MRSCFRTLLNLKRIDVLLGAESHRQEVLTDWQKHCWFASLKIFVDNKENEEKYLLYPTKNLAYIPKHKTDGGNTRSQFVFTLLRIFNILYLIDFIVFYCKFKSNGIHQVKCSPRVWPHQLFQGCQNTNTIEDRSSGQQQPCLEFTLYLSHTWACYITQVGLCCDMMPNLLYRNKVRIKTKLEQRIQSAPGQMFREILSLHQMWHNWGVTSYLSSCTCCII